MKNVIAKIVLNITPPIIKKIFQKIIKLKRYYKLDNIDKKLKKYYALDDIDKKLEKYLNYNNGFFIEVGANDGINQSNTYYLEKERNWRGILIEPAPNNYISCKKNRSNLNRFYFNACVSFEYKGEFVKMAYSNLVSTSFDLDSDISDPLKQAKSGMPSYQENEIPLFGAVACTLDDILRVSSAPKHIDFFSLDVEGAELEVLRGIDFQKNSFKYILIESRDINRINAFLNKKRYMIINQLSFHDYLFKIHE